MTSLGGVVAIDAVSRFIRHTGLRTEPLVSVVLPTRNRTDLLRRAIDSVRAQTYTRWELVVVDDGGDTDSEGVVDASGDERIRWMRIGHQGVCAARNAALAAAGGQIIAYLDDDNVMDPDWLYAVVWAFEQYPETDVLYGAFVVEDLLKVNRQSSGYLPHTAFHPWNRENLRRENLADIGAIAHRSGLPEARFDESLREMGDWDLLIRLTAEREPLALPAIACYYTTTAPDRLSGGPTHGADREKVRGRAQVVSR
jgi:glycosyltransferase involved in cell wall biosynthesis